jgi:hypothetical protein
LMTTIRRHRYRTCWTANLGAKKTSCVAAICRV